MHKSHLLIRNHHEDRIINGHRDCIRHNRLIAIQFTEHANQ